ncbi:hypothetical protein [uncultured Erythrobacter sp.]|uniref:hypothetical protein n=1 Tax=uncultured Erythrobacter sp. TaxID=263913 RepID=UPI00261BD585|nr:hypothetical protein [uncultured Erythrobacter sp.]
MLIACITALFVIVTLATALSLLDTWLRARSAFWSVFRERELLEAGFVPQVEASEVRLRQPLHRSARRTPQARSRKSGFAGARRSNLGSIQALG